MLSLSEKSVFPCLTGRLHGREFAIRVDSRLVGKVLFQKSLSTALPSSAFWYFLSSSPSSGALLFCFANPFNQILDSLNCGAHSGALRPCRISKTYLSIMLCLSRGEICPRPIDDAVSAAISTSVRFSGP